MGVPKVRVFFHSGATTGKQKAMLCLLMLVCSTAFHMMAAQKKQPATLCVVVAVDAV